VKLILVRHAAAIDRGAGISDERRYLTPEGRGYFRKTARTMREAGIAPDLILASPLLRAAQTADILAEHLKYGGPLIVTAELEPGFALPGLERLLANFGEAGEICLVGHEPDLSYLAVKLLGRTRGFNFKKGSAIRIDVDPGALHQPAGFKWLAAGKQLVSSAGQALG
jgi:phosphohistidine phosphatase